MLVVKTTLLDARNRRTVRISECESLSAKGGVSRVLAEKRRYSRGESSLRRTNPRMSRAGWTFNQKFTLR